MPLSLLSARYAVTTVLVSCLCVVACYRDKVEPVGTITGAIPPVAGGGPRHKAVQRMSRRGNCYDNAHAESFWSRFKIELLDGSSFRNLSEARPEISHYLAYYNAKRRHSALGYLAPNHFETHFHPTSQRCAA